jgi:hypothetical protein
MLEKAGRKQKLRFQAGHIAEVINTSLIGALF